MGKGRRGYQIDQDRLRALVEAAAARLRFGQTCRYRLEPLTKEEFGSGGEDRLPVTAGATDLVFGLRLLECRSSDAGAVALTGFQNATVFAPSWAVFLWEGWCQRAP